MTELERLAEGIVRAHKAGDANGVRVLGARYRDVQAQLMRDFPLAGMSREQLEAQDPAQHGGARGIDFLDDPLLGALAGGAIVGPAMVGKAAIKGAKLTGKALGYGGGAGVGIEATRRLLGE
jgi:hypothetical protein